MIQRIGDACQLIECRLISEASGNSIGSPRKPSDARQITHRIEGKARGSSKLIGHGQRQISSGLPRVGKGLLLYLSERVSIGENIPLVVEGDSIDVAPRVGQIG